MANVKQVVGAKTALTTTGLSTLASGSYATSATKDNTANQPSDLLIELSVTPGTVSANRQALVFALASIDGTNFQTGANTSDESVMTFIGALSLMSNATQQVRAFSVAGSYGGVLPPFIKFVVKNESGAAFTAAAVSTAEVAFTVT